MKYITKDEEGTLEVAGMLARTLRPGAVVALIGELGTGKTVFARGVARALGIGEKVTSPSFTLIHEYHGSIPLYHMDLFRMNSVEEMLNIGIEDYFSCDGICIIEWAEKMKELFPQDAVCVTLKHLGNTHREIDIDWPNTL